MYDFKGGPARYRTLLAGWLTQARDGDLLMCHVASGTPHGAAADALIAARRAEFEVLDSLEFDALVSDAGLQLAPMSRILAQPREINPALAQPPAQS